jgi:hypothetical protein
MSTIQTQLVRLAQRVDPFTKDGTELTAANIGTVAGDRFTAQRLLDCYNEARMILAQTISVMMPTRKKSLAISGNIVRDTAATFTSGVLTKPSGFVETLSLMTSAGQLISVLPASSVALTRYLDSANNPIVYEEAAAFRSENGTAYIPNASTYVFRYYGITNFGLASVVGPLAVTGATYPASPIVLTITGHKFVTGDSVIVSGVGGNTAANGTWVVTYVSSSQISLNGSTGNSGYTTPGVATPVPVNETYNQMWEALLIQLAEAIANEQGAAGVNQLAMRLIEEKKG